MISYHLLSAFQLQGWLEPLWHFCSPWGLCLDSVFWPLCFLPLQPHQQLPFHLINSYSCQILVMLLTSLKQISMTFLDKGISLQHSPLYHLPLLLFAVYYWQMLHFSCHSCHYCWSSGPLGEHHRGVLFVVVSTIMPCYGPKVYVPLKCICWSLNPQCDCDLVS